MLCRCQRASVDVRRLRTRVEDKSCGPRSRQRISGYLHVYFRGCSNRQVARPRSKMADSSALNRVAGILSRENCARDFQYYLRRVTW